MVGWAAVLLLLMKPLLLLLAGLLLLLAGLLLLLARLLRCCCWQGCSAVAAGRAALLLLLPVELLLLPVELLLLAEPLLLQIGCAVIFASKRNKAKRKRNFFRFNAKKVLFRLFRIDAKRRNLKRNEN